MDIFDFSATSSMWERITAEQNFIFYYEENDQESWT